MPESRERSMAAPFNPLAVAETVARNIVPVAGILFFGWQAASVLTLYLLDTVLMMAVIIAGVAREFVPPPADDGWAAQLNGEVGNVGIPLVLAAFIAIPIGVPLIFMTGGDLDGLWAGVSTPSFRTGVLVQIGMASWSWVGLRAAIDAGATLDQLRLKRRFALVFLRWMVLLMVAYFGVGFWFGEWSAFIFVALYAGTSIVIDIAPDRFLRAMPGGAEDADPPPGETRRASVEQRLVDRFRQKRKR
ncbi:MAG: DUF6498-containing protein [Casimicrobiaceae bacterium]